jgi:serine protease Do
VIRSLLTLLAISSLATPLVACKTETPDKIYTVSAQPADTTNRSISTSRRNAITTAVSKASPAVVGINVTEVREHRYDPWGGLFNDPFFNRLPGYMQDQFRGRVQRYQVKGLGSGFIISKDGYILTNDHVAGNASKIIVTTTDGAQHDAKLIGTDPTMDVSLLKIEGKQLPYLALGNSDDLAVGEWAIAMGNPFGLFEINDKPTVTVGVVSNTGVNLGIEGTRNYRGMIQTDAAISSGNSGGPLLNANGDVIGMNAVIRTTSQNYQGEAGSIGLGFAIPINKVKAIIEELKDGKKIDRSLGEIGFRVRPITDELKEYFHLTTETGVVVTDVLRNSNGGRAGLQPGDVITNVDNERVRSAEELQSVLADHRAGDTVTLKVIRNEGKISVKLKLGS